jgi:glycine/D-amino acid oxidase-like deaminating enzyme
MKLVVIGNGMVGHKLRKGLMAARHADREITVLCREPPARGRGHGLRTGECRGVLRHSAQWGDDAQVPVR